MVALLVGMLPIPELLLLVVLLVEVLLAALLLLIATPLSPCFCSNGKREGTSNPMRTACIAIRVTVVRVLAPQP